MLPKSVSVTVCDYFLVINLVCELWGRLASKVNSDCCGEGQTGDPAGCSSAF